MALTYTQDPIERAEHLRGKQAEIGRLSADAGAQFLVVWKDLHPVDAQMRPLIFGPEILTRLSPEAMTMIFLGFANETPWFALSIGAREEAPDLDVPCSFESLRAFGALLPAATASLTVYARAMAIWNQTHLHCTRCGTRTRSAEAGHSRICTDEACAQPSYPRSDPAVIMLISHGDKCLLGRKAEWRPGQFSTIAGFVEPGENIENAVRREVAEETGIKVGAVRYLASQPWPFPSSLMLGFRGEALSTDIRRDSEELEDCRWFTRDDVRAAETGPGMLLLPHRSSISRWLIEGWRDEG